MKITNRKTALILTGIWATWGCIVDSFGLPVQDQVWMRLALSIIAMLSSDE